MPVVESGSTGFLTNASSGNDQWSGGAVYCCPANIPSPAFGVFAANQAYRVEFYGYVENETEEEDAVFSGSIVLHSDADLVLSLYSSEHGATESPGGPSVQNITMDGPARSWVDWTTAVVMQVGSPAVGVFTTNATDSIRWNIGVRISPLGAITA